MANKVEFMSPSQKLTLAALDPTSRKNYHSNEILDTMSQRFSLNPVN
jgi:hypothetical protein